MTGPRSAFAFWVGSFTLPRSADLRENASTALAHVRCEDERSGSSSHHRSCLSADGASDGPFLKERSAVCPVFTAHTVLQLEVSLCSIGVFRREA